MRIRKTYTKNLFFLIVFNFLFFVSISCSKKISDNCRSHKLFENKQIYCELKSRTSCGIHLRGSPVYNRRRLMENGLCNNIFPELIVVPKSTMDVAAIVKISRKYKIPISVRSGGHSYHCASIKPYGIHIDMRGLNKIQLTTRDPFGPPGPALLLGPGQTWWRVLQYYPMDRYTYIHGQCTFVGVGGYLLGGGFQASGTTQRFGFGSFNVLQYTMVNADGNIIRISENNITLIDVERGRQHYLKDSHQLFRSLQYAGSSYGITTEFHYRIFDGPELLPVFALVYIDNDEDLLNFQRATADGRYCLTLYTYHFFTRPNLFSREMLGINLVRMALKLLPFLSLYRKRPTASLYIIDNYPVKNQIRTNKDAAYAFLKKYKMKLALDGTITDYFQGGDGNTENYQSAFHTTEQIKRLGSRPLVSASFWNATNILSFSKLFMNHPLFGLKNMDSRKSAASECEFCWFAITAINSDQINDLSIPVSSSASYTTANDVLPVDRGNIQADVTCMYKPQTNSRCPKIVKRAKTLMMNEAMRYGEKLTQYLNTPSCDKDKSFTNRYWNRKNYDMLLNAKKYWDPSNVFNHCQSVGNNDEHCCPSDV